MPKLNLKLKLDLNREQLLAAGAFGALLLICMLTTANALQTWIAAAQSLGERRDQLASLQSRVGATVKQRKSQAMAAPALAFLDAPTGGLAAAQFQAYLSQLIADQKAVLVSSGIQAAERDDKSDAIKLQLALTATIPALQELLYRLESGMPYVFVDSLLMQLGGSTERNAADPVLKVTLTVHAFWRRPSA
ncbi:MULTISPECIES: type II secretion system protein GspM [unclassified Bradyrhizobium]|uniref:type II secretion system protein GspM n=1 Tax=unclassified Bradyrhizobium TaxID=2631580 RepID=UPI002916FCC6|nr:MULTISPECIES: type II secretion system protein GspM [unclassified Bradyrhizobium]